MSENIAKQSNAAFLDRLESDDPAMVKSAADGVNDFTRTKMREDGFLRRILPPIPISDDELDREVHTDKPVKIVDLEIETPGSVSVGFATNPVGRYIRGKKYRVMFNRIMTPEFAKDIEELRTYNHDIRQVVSDNAIKDMLAEEDGKFIAAIDGIIGTKGSTVFETNAIQHKSITGSASITRNGIADSLKVMPELPSNLEAKTGLINHITVKDLIKFDRIAAGGDLAQDMLLNGFSEQKIGGVNWIVTIKRSLVANDSIYYFAEPRFLGKFYLLEDATMHLRKEAFMIQFFAYECLGVSIGNIAGVVKCKFDA